MGLLTPEATLKQPGHPSSESSCFWGLVRGKGTSRLLAHGFELFQAKPPGLHNANGPAFLPEDFQFVIFNIAIFSLRYLIFKIQYSAGPVEWDIGQPLYELT